MGTAHTQLLHFSFYEEQFKNKPVLTLTFNDHYPDVHVMTF